MGQKVHPLGFRIGVTERWRSRWNAKKKDFPRTLKEDQLIRTHLKKAYNFAGISMIEIERNGDTTTVIVHSARPGILIGKKGAKLNEIQAEIEKLRLQAAMTPDQLLAIQAGLSPEVARVFAERARSEG